MSLMSYAAGRKLLQAQIANAISLLNSGQLNQAAVQQLAQALGGSATNLAGVTQSNAAGAHLQICPSQVAVFVFGFTHFS